MSVQVENLEKNMAKITVEVSAEELEQAIQAAYMKQRSKISIPGFRKGKVPRAMIEKMYGVGIFFEEAADRLISKSYPDAVEESGLEVVSRPTIDIVQMEKEKPFIFTAEVAVKPEVTLGKYKGVNVTKVDLAVSEEEITEKVDQERNNNARTVAVEDRPVADGDTTVIDFEGFVDGVAFEGGKGENYSLVIGSHTFIDTFEEQLIGKNAGDDVEVNVTFPEEYHKSDLAGKAATFQVKIHEIKSKILPEADDDFAQDVSEFDTMEEYRESIRTALVEKKQNAAKQQQESEALEEVVKEAVMEIPDPMVAMQVDNMLNEFAGRMSQQGLSMEQYMEFTGATVETLREQMKPEALRRIQTSLVLEQVAKVEEIQVSDEDVEAELNKMAGMYGMEVDKLKEYMGDAERESMKKDLALQKAVDLIMENVIEVAEQESEQESAE